MAETKKLIPKRRFKEFQNAEAWEQCKLEDISEIIGGGTPSTINNDYWDGNIDWYAPAEIDEQIYASGSKRKITELGLKNSSAKILPPYKTILFTSRAGIGKTAILSQPGATNQGFQSLVMKDGYTPYFIYSMSNQIKEKAEAIASGSTFLEISGKMLGKLEIMVPKKTEQDKIGDHFKNLDNLITLHQRKLDKIKSTKKAYLYEMFPAEGESKPKRRFKGFTDDWELRKLGTLAQIKDSARVPNSLWRREGVPYLRSSNLDSITNEFLYISQNDYEMYKSKTGAPEFGDVLFNSGGNIGTAILKNDDNPVYVQGGAVLYIKTSVSKNLNGLFLKYYYETPTIKKYIVESCVGGTIKHFTLVPANAMPIVYPKIDEQKEIGLLFIKLDNLINLHQHKLDKLKNLKKSYLNEMFI